MARVGRTRQHVPSNAQQQGGCPLLLLCQRAACRLLRAHPSARAEHKQSLSPHTLTGVRPPFHPSDVSSLPPSPLPPTPPHPTPPPTLEPPAGQPGLCGWHRAHRHQWTAGQGCGWPCSPRADRLRRGGVCARLGERAWDALCVGCGFVRVCDVVVHLLPRKWLWFHHLPAAHRCSCRQISCPSCRAPPWLRPRACWA